MPGSAGRCVPCRLASVSSPPTPPSDQRLETWVEAMIQNPDRRPRAPLPATADTSAGGDRNNWEPPTSTGSMDKEVVGINKGGGAWHGVSKLGSMPPYTTIQCLLMGKNANGCGRDYGIPVRGPWYEVGTRDREGTNHLQRPADDWWRRPQAPDLVQMNTSEAAHSSLCRTN